MFKYLKSNKQWIFSGIGVFILGLLISGAIYLWRLSANQTGSDASANQLHNERSTSTVSSPSPTVAVTATREPLVPLTNKTPTTTPYHYSKELKEGQTFVDPYTGAAVGISYIFLSNRADGNVTLPGAETRYSVSLTPGTAWHFQKYGSTFSMIITEISSANKTFHVDISEDRK
jgi:hypothetical protein